MSEDLRMNAYWYSFSRTGVIEIDRILSAVASAGKGCHNTEDWTDYPKEDDNYIMRIQKAADDAAKAWRHDALP